MRYYLFGNTVVMEKNKIIGRRSSSLSKKFIPFRYDKAEDCPGSEFHTACPDDYGSYFAWCKKMSKTHKQRQCHRCGYWTIWDKKNDDMNVGMICTKEYFEKHYQKYEHYINVRSVQDFVGRKFKALWLVVGDPNIDSIKGRELHDRLRYRIPCRYTED